MRELEKRMGTRGRTLNITNNCGRTNLVDFVFLGLHDFTYWKKVQNYDQWIVMMSLHLFITKPM